MKINQLIQMVAVGLLLGTASLADQPASDSEFFPSDGGIEVVLKNSSQDEIAQYFRAANAGEPDAQNIVGSCYLFGLHVTQSYEEAVQWFRKAAEQGDAQAQFNLGLCYDRGWGVEPYKEKAMSWYRKAAEGGEVEALYNARLLYTSPSQRDLSTYRQTSVA